MMEKIYFSDIIENGALIKDCVRGSRKMDKEEIIAEIIRLKAETEELHEFLESRQKEYVSSLRLVNMLREKTTDAVTT